MEGMMELTQADVDQKCGTGFVGWEGIARAEHEATLLKVRDVLDFARGAILDAISIEDGLDGAAGEAIIKMITELLEDKDEYSKMIASHWSEDDSVDVNTLKESYFCCYCHKSPSGQFSRKPNKSLNPTHYHSW